MFCSNCGTELEDGALFCLNCGAKVAQDGAGTGDEKIETEEISPTGAVETGTAVVVPSESEQMDGGNKTARTRKKGIIWKAVIVIAVLAVVVTGVVAVPRIMGGLTAKDGEKDFILYIKDNELTIARKNKYEPVMIGDRTLDDKNDSIYLLYSGMISYSPDQKYMYYPQKINGSFEYDLYCRNVQRTKAEEKKIDSKVVSYEVIDNDRLVYLKGSTDNKLYLYHKGESEKLDSDVTTMQVSGDAKYILWISGGKMYVQDTGLKTDKVKLESGVSVLYGISDDFGTIVYQKNGTLYVMKGMEEKEKIASEVSDAYVYDINNSLRIYYVKDTENPAAEADVYGYDLIEDDCLEQDQEIVQPKIEDYQKITYKKAFWGMQQTVEIDDSYYEELEKYQQKQERDNLRGYLKGYVLTAMTVEREIYYYDDASGESDKILTAQSESESVYGNLGADTALMYVFSLDWEKIEKLKFSELTFAELSYADYYEITRQIENKAEESRQLLYLENGKVHEIKDVEDDVDPDFSFVWANEEDHMIYIRTFGGDHMQLYSVDYSQEGVPLKLITDELKYIPNCEKCDICYINEDGELYYGDDRIAKDACNVAVFDGEMILYMTDADKDGKEGTLNLYQNGRNIEIADDVATVFYGVIDTDKVVFLTDYNYKKNKGDLNVYDGKNVKKIDSDVSRIIY